MDKEFAEAFKEEIEEASKLPPHLAKFFDKDGNLKKDAADRVAKGKAKLNWKDVTPKGYGPKEEMDREFAEAFKEEIEERKMTDAEMAEREEIVKKLKPKLQSFKDKYGDDAKSVMYATATKQAMEDVERAKGDSIEGPATGKKHKCPTHVKKEGYGYGKNISHTLSENVVDKMNIYWYDSKEVSYMMPTSEVEIVSEGYHDETNHVEKFKSTKKIAEELSKLPNPIEEKKSHTGYELYHKTFSDAMQHAYAHAKSKGFVVDPKEIDDKVATGPKKPSSGKTNRYSLKAGRKKVEIQVANLDNKRYELNMYIEGVILESTKEYAKSLEKIANDKKMSMLSKSEKQNLLKIANILTQNKRPGTKFEEVELDEGGHTDVASAKNQVKVARSALQKMEMELNKLPEEGTLPSWWTNKVAIAVDKLDGMADYLDTQVEEVELEEAFSMGKGDKRVVDAFYDQKTIKAHGASILTTDGKTLTKRGMGGQDIAKWVNGKIKIVAVSDVKSTELILRYMKKSIPSGVFEEMGNVAPTAPDSGGIQYQAPVLGQKKKKKRQTIGEEVQRTTFAGKDVFIVDSDTYYNCRLGKKKYGRYEKYVGDGEVGQTIREYGLKYPRRPIILQNGESGPMLYLKYGRS
jgi:hypothetical protein